MAEGFLGRWSQRKQALREGRSVEEPALPAAVPQAEAVRSAPVPVAAPPAAAQPAQAVEPPAPPPTLQDVQALTPQSDFQRFMAPDVDPEVKNAAMKKLFADPHFNVMDGLDIYIDDYNKPDPMPASMLRQLASAQFLNLFDDEKKDAPAAAVAAAAPPNPVNPADTGPAPEPRPSAPPVLDHDDTDLQLQPDHAAGPQGSGRGPQ